LVVLSGGMLVAWAALAVTGIVGSVPNWVLWPLAVGAGAAGTLACAVAAKTGTGPVRSFWRLLTLAAGFMTAGTAAWSYDTLRDGGGPYARIHTNVLFLIAVGIAVTALLNLPSRRRTRRATVALCLDIAVVAVASALMAAQFLNVYALPGRGGSLEMALHIVVLGTAGATMVAVIKVSMTGAEPVHGAALWTLAPIGLLSPVTLIMAPLIYQFPHLNAIVVALPPAGLLFALAARSQTRVNITPLAPAAQPLPLDRPRRPGVWRRSVSFVPYVAVGATVAMLVVITLRTGYLRPGLAAGSAALIIVVMIRQLLALADNTELLDRLAEQADHDDLTRLPNRRFFTAALNSRTAATTVAVCDLDGFAALNDRLGDDCGDEILREAAARLTLTVGGDAVVARLLGDQFGILLPEHHELADGVYLTDTLLHAFRAPLRIDDRDLLVTVTAGVAQGSGETVPDLLRRAELALQSAQRAGGNRRQEYSSALDAGAAHDAQVAAALRRGLELGEFRLVYQPIVELPHGAVHGVEALVRWHPDGGEAVSPAEFIPVAEHSGLIVELGLWIIDTACADAAAWHRRHGDDAPWISVNVSARQLLDPELPAQVADALHRHRLEARHLTLEITETAVFTGGAAMAAVQALRDLGTGIALDDFGTGHSSLTLLRTCPVTTLKVDKSFIDGLNGTAQQEAIATSLSGIASTLQLRAVAEGVESQAQATRLHDLGYRYAQGFHFARPVPFDQIDALLAGELTRSPN
jgi:diguanylate cyclase (GGDEF)-like protein